MADWVFDEAVRWLLANAVLATLKLLWGWLAQTAFISPDVTGLPQVAAVSSRSLQVVNTVFVLAVLAVGVTAMSNGTVQARYRISDLIPRLVLGFVAANFATPLCAHLIGLANALTAALTGDGLAAEDAFEHLYRVVTAALTSPANAVLTAVIGLVVAALTAALLVVWLIRIGVLVVLAGIAPAALACHATPYTDGVARLWWRALLGTLATVVLQAVALQTTLAVFLNPDANLPQVGLPADPSGTVNLLIVACLLWATVKIPTMMRRYVTHGGQTNVAALMLRTVVVQQVTGRLRLPRPAARTAGRSAARTAGRAGAGAATAAIPYRRRPPRPGPVPTPRAALPPPAATPANAAAAPPAQLPRTATWTNPATVMPPRRPRWTATTTSSGTGWPDPPTARPPLPPGARPTGTGWAGRTPRPTGGARQPGPHTPGRAGGHSGQ